MFKEVTAVDIFYKMSDEIELADVPSSQKNVNIDMMASNPNVDEAIQFTRQTCPDHSQDLVKEMFLSNMPDEFGKMMKEV